MSTMFLFIKTSTKLAGECEPHKYPLMREVRQVESIVPIVQGAFRTLQKIGFGLHRGEGFGGLLSQTR